MNYYPLFRVRSWNNGVRCMSFYILMVKITWINILLIIHKCSKVALWLISLKIFYRNSDKVSISFCCHFIWGNQIITKLRTCYESTAVVPCGSLCSDHFVDTWLRAKRITHRTFIHYSDVIMSAMASQITSLAIVCSVVYSGADQRKHESSASLAFVQEIRRWPVNSPHKWPVTRKMFPFDDVIMYDGQSLVRWTVSTNDGLNINVVKHISTICFGNGNHMSKAETRMCDLPLQISISI